MDPTFQMIWRFVVEVAVLTVALYYAFMFLRGTRGWPVVIGFVLLLSITQVTDMLELDVLHFVLSSLTPVVSVAVVVLFQPELRRMLGELGNLPLFNANREQRENIEVIVQAAERLAEARIGALMAIEMSIQLQEVVESGIPVDCEATPEMLETIFFPNNAIHDGGVILKGDRISFAACIFPLTQRQDLNKSLGTRHRAAIGLTEETDAVVVVVSEENGSISHAHRGQLERRVSAEELRSFLTSVLVKRDKAQGWIRRTRAWTRRRFRVSSSASVTGKVPKPAVK